DRLVLHRRHSNNATPGPQSLSAHVIGEARRVDEPYAAWCSALAEEYARRAVYLEGLRPAADRIGDEARRGLARSVAAHHRLAQSYARRAAAYRENFASRALSFGRNAVRGDYRS